MRDFMGTPSRKKRVPTNREKLKRRPITTYHNNNKQLAQSRQSYHISTCTHLHGRQGKAIDNR